MSGRPTFFASALRVFDFSLGQMLWSRRSVFLALLVGAPVLLAVAVRIFAAAGWLPQEMNEARAIAAQILRLPPSPLPRRPAQRICRIPKLLPLAIVS